FMTIDLLVDDQFGRSDAVPDQKVRFPFLQIEFKSQAKNGTHYIATNQAAGAGAIALNGNLELIRRSFGMEKFDCEEPRYFSVTIDHQLACVNVHWLKAPAEKGGQHSFHVEGLSKHLLDDANGIRALSRAIKNILDNGADARLRTLCGALDAYRETQTRRGNGNLNIDQNRILDNKAEEECLRLRFKQGLHLAKKSQPADHRLNRFSRYTLANEAEEEHLCRKFNREKTYFPEKKSELAGSHLDRSNLCTLSNGRDAYRPQRA
ncbi:hypothetical protein LTR98_011888, partial [Exophiala xenobiotica]